MMDKSAVRAKFQAMGLHLLFSLLLVLVGFALLLMWYPAWLFWSDGGIQVLWLLVGVDLILGPALTFVVYNPKKSVRERILDLSLIILIQLGAFGYGMYQAYDQRSLTTWYDQTTNIALPCPFEWYRVVNSPIPTSLISTNIQQFRSGLSSVEFAQQRHMSEQNSAACVLSSQFEPLGHHTAMQSNRPKQKIAQLSDQDQKKITDQDNVVLFVGRYRDVLLVLDEQFQVDRYYYVPEQ